MRFRFVSAAPRAFIRATGHLSYSSEANRIGETADWEAIGAIGEMLGAGAVVVTLAYLAIQNRYARDTAADVNRLSRAVGVREIISAQKTVPGLMDAWVRAEGSVSQFEQLAEKLGLDLQEAILVESQCQGWWWIHWAQWTSITTEKNLKELTHLISEFYSVPPMSTTWKHSSNARLLGPGFQTLVNEIIREGRKSR